VTTHRPAFTLLAGVEIAGGHLSALHHGQVDQAHSFGDPAEAARHFVGDGAHWLHVADLDAAAGTGDNRAVVTRILADCGSRAHVQLAGGIRDDASLRTALATGASRVVLETSALDDPAWVAAAVAAHPDRVVVGVTADHHRVYAPGSSLHGTDLAALLTTAHDTGARFFLVSDVDARGLRKSSERHALDSSIRALHGHVTSDGGVFRLGDLHALTELIPHGLDAVVVDAALYTGGFTFAEAVAALQERFDLFYWGPPQP